MDCGLGYCSLISFQGQSITLIYFRNNALTLHKLHNPYPGWVMMLYLTLHCVALTLHYLLEVKEYGHLYRVDVISSHE